MNEKRQVSMPSPIIANPRPVTKLWKHHPDVVPLVGNLTETEKSRQEIIFEFVNTEKSYNADLELIFEV
jgi:hypothetical protein